jgi:hypothetical protein
MNKLINILRNFILSHQYYQIIGGYTKEPIGKCTGIGLSECKKEEPTATFKRISRRKFESKT